MDADKTVRELIETGAALFPLPLPYSDLVEEVSCLFQEFLFESQGYKDKWTFDVHKNGDIDDGYFYRTGKEVGDYTQDHKEILHYSPRLEGLLQERGIDYSRHRDLLSGCQKLYKWCENAGLSLAQGIEEKTPDCKVRKKMSSAKDLPQAYVESKLRLVRYNTSQRNKKWSAGEHTDRDILTFQLGGSDLDSFRVDGELFPVEQGCVRVFLGEKAGILSQGRLKPAWHSVVPSEQSSHWSVVFFANGHPPITEGKHR